MQRAYDFTATVDDASGFEFSWTVTNTTLQVGLACTSSGWVALGLGEAASGGMAGLDVVQLHVEGQDGVFRCSA